MFDSYDDFRNIDFNDVVSSIKVFKGPNFKAGDVARFYNAINKVGGYIELAPGDYKQIHLSPFNFNDVISSVGIFNPVYDDVELSPHYIIHLFDGANFTGRERIIFDSVSDLNTIGFTNKPTSVLIENTSKWTGDKVVNLFDANNFTGGVMSEKLNLGKVGTAFPIEIKNLAAYAFDNKISSVKVGLPIRLDKFGKVEMMPAGVKAKEEVEFV